MTKVDYLIVGSSHAALEAADAIRTWDEQGSITMVTRDDHPPYSPTVLPYVVSGRSDPDRVVLRKPDHFAERAIDYLGGRAVTAVDPQAHTVSLDDGATLEYGKLLLATGAAPAIPPVAGLADAPYHVLRTMADAVGLRDAMTGARTAVVLGAGLVGMHAAENLAKAGAEVAVVEMGERVLPAYFDETAGGMIADTFRAKGVALHLGRTATEVRNGAVVLDDGTELSADLLLVATGVRPVTGYLDGSGIEVDQGILVDERMATSAPDVWAAGDVAQARDFYEDRRTVVGILPTAVEQGRIAGMAMAGDPTCKPYPGGVPLNTYTFFGRRAVSVGIVPAEGAEVDRRADDAAGTYRTLAFDGGRLVGAAAIDEALDPGVLWQLILRRVDLSAVKDDFVARPLETGRAVMSKMWR